MRRIPLVLAAVLATALPAASGGLAAAGTAPEAQHSGSISPTAARRMREAKQTIRLMVRGLNARDTRICRTMFTARMLRQSTGLSGRPALARCRRQIRTATGHIRLNRFEGVRIVGRRALVQFTSSIGVYAKRQVMQLRRSRGRYLVDGAA